MVLLLSKKKLALVIAVVSIVIIASIGTILYLHFQRKGKEINVLSYQELCADFDVESWKFRSFSDGDIIHLKDTVIAVNCTTTLFGTYIFLAFSTLSYNVSIPPSAIHLAGNKTEEYVVGREVEISLRVKTITM